VFQNKQKVMKRNISIENIAIRFGLLTAFGLITYFLIMNLVGLVYIVELRVFNFVILAYGVWLALKKYVNHTGDEIVYLRSLILGVLTSLIAVAPFAIFIFIYMSTDVAFMQHIVENEIFGQYLNPYIVSFLIFFEGMISGFFIAFTLMQYMKKSYIKSATQVS